MDGAVAGAPVVAELPAGELAPELGLELPEVFAVAAGLDLLALADAVLLSVLLVSEDEPVFVLALLLVTAAELAGKLAETTVFFDSTTKGAE